MLAGISGFIQALNPIFLSPLANNNFEIEKPGTAIALSIATVWTERISFKTVSARGSPPFLAFGKRP